MRRGARGPRVAQAEALAGGSGCTGVEHVHGEGGAMVSVRSVAAVTSSSSKGSST